MYVTYKMNLTYKQKSVLHWITSIPCFTPWLCCWKNDIPTRNKGIA